jgi:hypothetical protein
MCNILSHILRINDVYFTLEFIEYSLIKGFDENIN